MTGRVASLPALSGGDATPGPGTVFFPGPTRTTSPKDETMSDTIDEQVQRFRAQLDQLSPTPSTEQDSLDLFGALAAAPNRREAAAVLVAWAGKYTRDTDYRDVVVIGAIIHYALYTVFTVSELDARGNEGHLAKLGMIKLTCRALDITLKEHP